MALIKTNTVENAVGKWRGILTTLGIDDKFLTGKHGPCPCCNGSDRFRFDDQKGGGSFFCSGCGPGNGIQLLMRFHGWDFATAAKRIDEILGTVDATPAPQERTDEQKIAAIKNVLQECRKVQAGDPVWKYLNRRTGITEVPPDIKFHPALYHRQGGNHPAMISTMRDASGKGVSLHRTYLTEDGEKAPVTPVKMFMSGLLLPGSAVRLSCVHAHIGIAEGVENALAAGRLSGLPVWAATNATLLQQWQVPAGVEKVTIFSDNDVSYTGQAAAYNLAKRLMLENIATRVKIPEVEGTDWADESCW